jgi:hypothetical protein
LKNISETKNNIQNIIIILGLVSLAFMALAIFSLAHATDAYRQKLAEQGITVDPKRAEWFHKLTDKNGSYCCSEADCKEVEMDVKNDKYFVHIPEGQNVEVDEKYLVPLKQEQTNPTGSAILCYNYYKLNNQTNIRCFARGSLQ